MAQQQNAQPTKYYQPTPAVNITALEATFYTWSTGIPFLLGFLCDGGTTIYGVYQLSSIPHPATGPLILLYVTFGIIVQGTIIAGIRKCRLDKTDFNDILTNMRQNVGIHGHLSGTPRTYTPTQIRRSVKRTLALFLGLLLISIVSNISCLYTIWDLKNHNWNWSFQSMFTLFWLITLPLVFTYCAHFVDRSFFHQLMHKQIAEAQEQNAMPKTAKLDEYDI